MTTLAEVKAREEELEREWFWLVEALNTVARVRAEHLVRGPARPHKRSMELVVSECVLLR
jgi:hypothetical protein